MSSVKEAGATFHIGDSVRIRESIRSPYAAHFGTVSEVDSSLKPFEYLIRFSDGLAFRYSADEMELIQAAG